MGKDIMCLVLWLIVWFRFRLVVVWGGELFVGVKDKIKLVVVLLVYRRVDDLVLRLLRLVLLVVNL